VPSPAAKMIAVLINGVCSSFVFLSVFGLKKCCSQYAIFPLSYNLDCMIIDDEKFNKLSCFF